MSALGRTPSVLSIALISLLGASLFAQQANRASVTGIVTDPTSAIIPGVSVTAVHAETGVVYRTSSNQSGNYLLGNLPIGQYTLTFSADGFKEVARSGLVLEAGQVARIDIHMEVGQVTEKVVVTADAPLLQTETAQASESVSGNVFNNLPLSFGGARNMAAFADKLVPGVKGSDWTMKIQGTPGQSQSIVIDGMKNLSGFLVGDFNEASVSPEAIQEMTVFTGSGSAEFGSGAGGALNFTLKSGANQVHGSGFYYLRNEVLNANDWNNNRMLAADPNFTNPSTQNFKRPPHRRQDGGFSFGGPAYIPKIYDGRNRTFFYVTLEKFRNQTEGLGSLVRTVPQPEMFDGNLSRLLTGRQVGTDILGRPVMEGQIYDPSTLREVNGQFVADPFLGNIIPASRISTVAKNFKPIFAQYYPPVSSDLTNNLYWTNHYSQRARQGTIKADHSFSPLHKVSGFYYWHGFPREFQDAGGLWSVSDPTYGGPLARAMIQHRNGYSWSANYDWTVRPTVINHANLGVNVNKNVYASRQAGKKYASAWGVKGVGLGLPEDLWTAPAFNLGSSPVASFESWGKTDNRDVHYKGIIAGDTLRWQRGAHSLAIGFEFVRMATQQLSFDNSGGSFNFNSRTTGIPGQSYSSRVGNSFASFLLGLVDSGNLRPPINLAYRRHSAAAFVQDNWKLNPRLTLNWGLRWSGDSPIYEAQDLMANFNPYLPDPNANGMLGAVEYMGNGPGRNGKRSPVDGYWKNIGPSFGFAYQLSTKVVARGSYGISYTPETIGWAHYFIAGLTQTNSVDANSSGIYRPVFNIDGGYPGVTTPVNPDPSWGQKRGSTMVSPDYTKAGYIQHFHFGIQAEVARDLVVEADWRASKGTRLHAGDAVRPNQIRQEELSRGAVLGQIINTPEKAAAAGLSYPYAGWSGIGANTLMPFPQINTQSLTAWGDPVGFSNYQSGNLIATKRMSRGFHLYGAYTFSKTISNVDGVDHGGTVFGIQDAYNRPKYKAIDPGDRTHVIKSSLSWDIPFGKGRPLLSSANRVLNGIVGGWTAAAILNYASGTPLGVPGALVSAVGWNGPGLWSDFNAPAGGFKRVFDPSKFNPWDANDPGNRFFDPSVFSNPAPQTLGNSPGRFPQVRGLWSLNEDASIVKRFSVRESFKIQLRMELLNAFNRHYFSGPEMNRNQPYFGNVRTASGARTGQFGMRVDW